MKIKDLETKNDPERCITLIGFGKLGIKIGIVYHISSDVSFELF
jgi:predicted ThiF/HesA family dinucleotide-utilizing enzyme